MQHELTSPCQCTECPGAGCRCGCQQPAPALALQAAPPSCGCESCGCEAAEQGCLCH